MLTGIQSNCLACLCVGVLLEVSGVYDGKAIRALPDEPWPMVAAETLVEIVFLDKPITSDDLSTDNGEQALSEQTRQRLAHAPTSRDWLPLEHRVSLGEVWRRLDALRERIGPIGISINELKDEARAG